MNTYLLILNKETLITIHYIFFIILGYVLGSIMFGYLIPKIFKQVDTKKIVRMGILELQMLLFKVACYAEFVHFY